MPDENGNPTAAERTVASTRTGESAFFNLTSKLKQAGHKAFGADEFDRASRSVAKAMGDEFDGFTLQVAQRDNAPRILHRLAERSDELEKIKSLPAHRRDVALANMEKEWASHGHLSTANEPAWMSKASMDRPSAQDFSRGRAWETASDKDLDEHMAERARMKRGRGW